MVKKPVTSPAAIDDHKVLVNSISKKSNLHSLAKVLKPKVYILSDSSTFKNLVQELTGNGNIGCKSVSAGTSPSSSCATTFKPIDHEQVPFIQNSMMYTSEDYSFQEISPEISLHSSDHHIGLISIPVTSGSPPCTIISQPLEQVPVIGNNMMYSFEDYGFQESSPELSFDSPDHHIDLISTLATLDFSQEIIDYMPTKDHEFQSTWDMMSFPIQDEEMEPWYLEMDSSASAYNNYGLQWLQPLMPQEEVCAFDCDLFIRDYVIFGV
ncbi:hypothetical protein POM88_012446 [Heracleum sosnowskyi]|uniref:VQ domain-containing protein n=1 Tax=Heracleum sosnowskyi TaxID=360622 RepID=A0AAD8MXC7_9APIA|nr:hypothetical protein POM88_012446 [Heracleum sosnowskyi]